MSGSTIISIEAFIVIALLFFYVLGGSFIEHRKFIIGHETGVAIIMGLLISLIAWLSGYDEVNSSLEFNGTIFFYLCLPPIIFASGFNMRRKRFFENIGYIVLFGLFGTIFTFVMFSILTWAFF